MKQANQKKKSQKDAQIQDLNDLTLKFQSEGQNFVVDLHLNHQLIPDGYFQKYHKEVGAIIRIDIYNFMIMCSAEVVLLLVIFLIYLHIEVMNKPY